MINAALQFPEARKHILTCAPSGSAAILIHGFTVHSSVGMRVDPRDPNTPANLDRLKPLWKDIRLLIVDEKSMMYLAMLAVLDRNLRLIGDALFMFP